MQSVDNISAEAKIAYQAFLDMSNSKTAHFSCLEAIEIKYSSGGAPSIAENSELKRLLAIHDRNVMAFNAAIKAVKNNDEKKALMGLIS